MKRNFKFLAVLVSLVLVLGVSLNGTLAYLFTKSDTVANTFDPGHVGCEVIANNDGTFTVKPDSLTNTTVYLRAAVVATWVKDGSVHFLNPVVKVDGKNWVEHDGYYYYQEEVAPNGAAYALTVTPKEEDAPSGYELQIQVLGEAIQSKPGGNVVTWDKDGMN